MLPTIALHDSALCLLLLTTTRGLPEIVRKRHRNSPSLESIHNKAMKPSELASACFDTNSCARKGWFQGVVGLPRSTLDHFGCDRKKRNLWYYLIWAWVALQTHVLHHRKTTHHLIHIRKCVNDHQLVTEAAASKFRQAECTPQNYWWNYER